MIYPCRFERICSDNQKIPCTQESAGRSFTCLEPCLTVKEISTPKPNYILSISKWNSSRRLEQKIYVAKTYWQTVHPLNVTVVYYLQRRSNVLICVINETALKGQRNIKGRLIDSVIRYNVHIKNERYRMRSKQRLGRVKGICQT